MGRTRYLHLAAAILCLCATTVAAQDNTTPLGLGFTGRPLVLRNDIVLEDLGGYSVVRDLADATRPLWLSTLDHDNTDAGIWGEILHDGDLAVAIKTGATQGFAVVSVADPAQPAVLGTVSQVAFTSGWLRGTALIMAQTGSFFTYDLVDPEAPALVTARWLGTQATDRWFCDLGDVLYCIDQGPDLRGYDVTVPLQPVDLGVTSLGGSRIAALAAGDGVLYAVMVEDLAGKATQTVLSTLQPLSALTFTETSRLPVTTAGDQLACDLTVDDDLLLLATDDGQVRAFGLATPAQPAAGFVLPRSATQVALGASKLLVQGPDRLAVYTRTAFDGQPQLLVDRPTLPRFRSLHGHGPVVWAQSYEEPNLLYPVDVANPYVPLPGEPFDMGLAGSLHVTGDLGMVIGAHGFQLLDLSDPLHPAQLGAFSSPEREFFGDNSLLAPATAAVLNLDDSTLQLELYDLSDPLAPVYRSSVENAQARALSDDLLVVRTGYELRFWSLANLGRPREISALDVGQENLDVRLVGQRAYALTRQADGVGMKLDVIDLHDPAAPVSVWSQDLPGNGYQLAVNGPRLHVSGFPSRIYDISTADEPVPVGSYDAWTVSFVGPPLLAFDDDIVVTGDWLVTLRDDSYDLSAVPAPTFGPGSALEAVYPNPFNATVTIVFSLPRTEFVTVSVHDARGRHVADVAREVFAAGRHTVAWRGLDAGGQRVASGVYYVGVLGETTQSVGKVTLVK